MVSKNLLYCFLKSLYGKRLSSGGADSQICIAGIKRTTKSKLGNNKDHEDDDCNLGTSKYITSVDFYFLVQMQLAVRMETNLNDEMRRNVGKFAQPRNQSD